MTKRIPPFGRNDLSTYSGIGAGSSSFAAASSALFTYRNVVILNVTKWSEESPVNPVIGNVIEWDEKTP